MLSHPPTGANDLVNQAEVLLVRRELPGAFAAFEAASRLGADPDRCCGGLWQAHMLDGNYAAAWLQSDALRHRGAPDPHRFWNGEPLTGKRVIVRCLHGFGDAVQMLRYAPLLSAAASRVIFEVPPRLLPLARFFKGVEDVITWGDLAPAHPPVWDVQLEVMELPYLFRSTLADLPLATHYLELPKLQLEATKQKMGESPRPRIGLSSEAGEWNRARNCPREALAPLLVDSRYEFWNLSLQPVGQGTGELTPLHSQPAITGDGIVPLAATIAHLDLVVTVDTLAAHLAGALGIPAFLLLQHAADWRWMTGIDRSPWYPSIQLFRQPTPGDWSSVIEAVRQQLGKLKL